jgi:hypothetical protein
MVNPVLVFGGSLLFGMGVSVAQTKCLMAITARFRARAAAWDLVINGLSLVVIYEHSLAAFVSFAVGSAIGTYYSIDKKDSIVNQG